MRTPNLFFLFTFVALAFGVCTRTYTVKSGDTCYGIAQSQGVSVDVIYSLNPDVASDCSNLEIGQVLCLAKDDSGGNSTSLTTVYAIWHCGDDCAWTYKPDLSTSSWILNRGDGKPTANLVILAFMDPTALVNGQNSNGYVNGVPKGMIDSLSYFTSKGITVMFSIGGASWSDKFVSALKQNAAQFAKNAAAAARKYGVGIEIDVEVDNNSYENELTTFVNTYRSLNPYQSGANASAWSLLTIDAGSGTDYLGTIASLARTWVSQNKINWLNAMVDDKPWTNINSATSEWQQHLSAGLPAKDMVVSHYGSNTCKTYSGILPETVSWAKSKGVRGIAFWAAGSGGGEFVENCPGIQQGSKALLG